MKKYFAKYLSVEGEIKANSKVLHEADILTADHYDSWFNKWEFKEKSISPTSYDKNCKPVELFLCFRYIQVGDEVYYKGSETTQGLVTQIDLNNNTIWINNAPVTASNYYPVRSEVIGEISPEATWVKEGDEFDENDVRVIYNFVGEDSEDQLYTFEEWEKEAKEWFKYKRSQNWVKELINCPTIAIKGLCGHFH